MSAAFKSDRDLREALKCFFDEANKLVQPAGAEAVAILGHPFWRLTKGVWFSGSDSAQKAEAAVVHRATKLLGPIISHERDLSDLLWQVAARRAKGTPNSGEAAISTFLDELEGKSSLDQVYIDANHVIAFDADVTDIRIGPVRAVVNVALEAELASAFPNRKWSVAVGVPSFAHSDGRITLNMPTCLWQVSLRASDRTVKEQAAWLIDIATSLLRLSHHEIDLQFPAIGDLEAHPLAAGEPQTMAMVMVGGDLTVPGERTRGIYHVDAALRSITLEQEFQERLVVFDPKKGSVAERVAQGLGWMARGRRTADRAERLLYFFTAIEALLSSDDKAAPVTQTIARHAAVVLAASIEHRVSIAGQIRALYAARSALVHTGKRIVSQSEANTVQYLVETLYAHILDVVDLNSPFQAFNNDLAVASYGGAWPVGTPYSSDD